MRPNSSSSPWNGHKASTRSTKSDETSTKNNPGVADGPPQPCDRQLATLAGGLLRRAGGQLQRPLEEFVDGRSQVGDPQQRIRAVSDRRQADVADVGTPRATECRHKPIGRPYVDLLVALAVDQ